MAINLDLGFNLAGALLIIGILAFIAVIYYIDYLKKKNEPQSRPSVIMKTIVISFTIISILLIIFYLSGEKPNKWHYMGMIMIVVIIYWAAYYEAQKFKMKRPEEIIEEQKAYLFRMFHAEPDLSGTFGLNFPKYKVIEVPGGKIFDVESCTLIRTNLGFFLLKSNPYENIVMEHQFMPPMQKIEEIWDNATARRYDEERLEIVQSLQEAKKYGTQKESTL